MKKFIIFLCLFIINFFVINLCCNADARASFPAYKKLKSVAIENKYIYDTSGILFDLQTFKYDQKKNTYSIDLFINFNGGEYLLDSPYKEEKDSVIRHLIVNITVSKSVNNYKADMKYKGFITCKIGYNNNTSQIYDVKKHYENEIRPELKKYYYVYKNNLNRPGYGYQEYVYPEITETIYNAYKKGKLYEIPGAQNYIY